MKDTWWEKLLEILQSSIRDDVTELEREIEEVSEQCKELRRKVS